MTGTPERLTEAELTDPAADLAFRTVREEIALHMADVKSGMWSVENASNRAARMIVGFYAPGNFLNRQSSAPDDGWPELAKDRAWLERQRDTGHCGESTSEAIQRGRIDACIDRILAALPAPPSSQDKEPG